MNYLGIKKGHLTHEPLLWGLISALGYEDLVNIDEIMNAEKFHQNRNGIIF